MDHHRPKRSPGQEEKRTEITTNANIINIFELCVFYFCLCGFGAVGRGRGRWYNFGAILVAHLDVEAAWTSSPVQQRSQHSRSDGSPSVHCPAKLVKARTPKHFKWAKTGGNKEVLGPIYPLQNRLFT
eukprot:891868-Amphidinium_carterae.1